MGRGPEALREWGRVLKDGVEIDNWSIQRKALQMRGWFFAAANADADARRAAGELDALSRQAMNPNEALRVDFVLGEIELHKENWSAAIEQLKKAGSKLYHEYAYPGDEQALYLEPLALAIYGSGDLDKAGEVYARITALTTGRLVCGDIYARAFYSLGRIAEQRGDNIKARESYRKFLDLWKDADPGIPEVEEARKRLAGLKGT
jgi:tetratricopeptide (TPR) repeat protein